MRRSPRRPRRRRRQESGGGGTVFSPVANQGKGACPVSSRRANHGRGRGYRSRPCSPLLLARPSPSANPLPSPPSPPAPPPPARLWFFCVCFWSPEPELNKSRRLAGLLEFAEPEEERARALPAPRPGDRLWHSPPPLRSLRPGVGVGAAGGGGKVCIAIPLPGSPFSRSVHICERIKPQI